MRTWLRRRRTQADRRALRRWARIEGGLHAVAADGGLAQGERRLRAFRAAATSRAASETLGVSPTGLDGLIEAQDEASRETRTLTPLDRMRVAAWLALEKHPFPLTATAVRAQIHISLPAATAVLDDLVKNGTLWRAALGYRVVDHAAAEALAERRPTVELVCADCGRQWDAERRKGNYPQRCPACSSVEHLLAGAHDLGLTAEIRATRRGRRVRVQIPGYGPAYVDAEHDLAGIRAELAHHAAALDRELIP